LIRKGGKPQPRLDELRILTGGKQLWNRPNVKKKVIKISKSFDVLDEFPIRDSLTPVMHPAWFDSSLATLTQPA